ncbi:MAG: hypothetical protein RLZZ165_248 [Bacteroidota bacterium]
MIDAKLIADTILPLAVSRLFDGSPCHLHIQLQRWVAIRPFRSFGRVPWEREHLRETVRIHPVQVPSVLLLLPKDITALWEMPA